VPVATSKSAMTAVTPSIRSALALTRHAAGCTSRNHDSRTNSVGNLAAARQTLLSGGIEKPLHRIGL
jgi:hypothetical protein